MRKRVKHGEGDFGGRNISLRRTAAEVKRYRMLMRIIPIAVASGTVLLALVYTVTVFYSKFGSFTVSINKMDKVEYGLTLSETPDFAEPSGRLNARASEEITNIDGKKDLPQDLDSINGSHNGQNYVAYTFYCMNVGTSEVSYEYQLKIENTSYNIEKAIRVRLYIDGEAEDFARTKTDGSGPEEGTTEFLTEDCITKGQVDNFKPKDYTKYTVVIWLEGNDIDCTDDILGGTFKIDMYIDIIGVDGEGAKVA